MDRNGFTAWLTRASYQPDRGPAIPLTGPGQASGKPATLRQTLAGDLDIGLH